MEFKARVLHEGNHVRITVWSGKGAQYTFANNGDLMFDADDYQKFIDRLKPLELYMDVKDES